MQEDKGITVEKTVTINKPVAQVYAFWHDFENLPRFMKHLESVNVTGPGRSHWVAKAPLGAHVEWDAEIIEELENKVIAWRSVGETPVPNAGYVHFQEQPAGRGTVVKVALEYRPPAGQAGAAAARAFHEEPGQQVEEDLTRFKEIMEAGETPTTQGQPSGRMSGGDGDRERSGRPLDKIDMGAKDTVTEASEESFPASDAPSWSGTRESGV